MGSEFTFFFKVVFPPTIHPQRADTHHYTSMDRAHFTCLNGFIIYGFYISILLMLQCLYFLVNKRVSFCSLLFSHLSICSTNIFIFIVLGLVGNTLMNDTRILTSANVEGGEFRRRRGAHAGAMKGEPLQ